MLRTVQESARWSNSETESTRVFSRAEGRQPGELFNGDRVAVLQDENIPVVGGGDGGTNDVNVRSATQQDIK